MSKPIMLLPHGTPPAGIPAPWVRIGREGANLSMTFRLPGDTRRVRVSAPIEPLVKQSEARRADRLWEHTCFECFVRIDGADDYFEFNFSPSQQWAAYRFDSYRAGMRQADVPIPVIVSTPWAKRLEVSAAVHLPEWGDRPWLVNLAAVIEDVDGRTSYWALSHPPGKPDFHHPDCFTLELPAA
jgi:hypothetical protein